MFRWIKEYIFFWQFLLWLRSHASAGTHQRCIVAEYHDYGHLLHTYQSLSCETAINTEISLLFSLKRIYVKYKNAILSNIGCSFRI